MVNSALQTIWVCGRIENTGYRPLDWLRKKAKIRRWHIIGVFESEAKAKASCRDKDYFIGQLPFNTQLPHLAVGWPGAYFPLAEESPSASFQIRPRNALRRFLSKYK